jgi:hypothetical protein
MIENKRQRFAWVYPTYISIIVNISSVTIYVGCVFRSANEQNLFYFETTRKTEILKTHVL